MTKYCLFIAVLFSMLLTGCSIFQFERYKNFGDWYIGKPGLKNTFSVAETPEESETYVITIAPDLILEERPVIYGHFRLFEIVFQPSGGITYPQRLVASAKKVEDDESGLTLGSARELLSEDVSAEGSTTEYEGLYAEYTETKERDDVYDSLAFDLYEAGVIEFIPYRTYSSNESFGYKATTTLLQPFVICLQVLHDGIIRAPVYAVHDVVKIFAIPAAAIYYSSRPDDKKQEKPLITPNPISPEKPTSKEREPKSDKTKSDPPKPKIISPIVGVWRMLELYDSDGEKMELGEMSRNIVLKSDATAVFSTLLYENQSTNNGSFELKGEGVVIDFPDMGVTMEYVKFTIKDEVLILYGSDGEYEKYKRVK